MKRNRDCQNVPPLLQLRGLSKSFLGVTALSDVDFTLQRGEIHALLGENGAGKSTLIKVLTGVYRREAGAMFLDGQSIDPRSPWEAQSLGISTVYQEVNLIPHLSVAENVCLGRQPMKFGRIDWKALRRRAEAALARLGVAIDVTQSLASYSIAMQQLAAVARALDLSAKLLILDEPTSSLDENEVARLFEILRKLKRAGLGILFVTHFLDQVYAVTDRITVLRNGRRVGEYETASLPRLDLIARMMGKDIGELESRPDARRAGEAGRGQTVFFQARGLARKGAVVGFDLDVSSGEVVGLAGLLGSGRTEIARLLFGIDRADAGEMRADGRRISIRSPRHAIRHGFGFCPEDRKTEGIIPDLSVRENIILALQASRGWWAALSRPAQVELAAHYIRALNIAAADAETPIQFLSGGNQQKAILARWLAAQPRFLILDEPTRGIDVGAKLEIERLVQSLAAQGVAMLFISSELDEVVRNSRRVIVLRDHAKIAELSGESLTEQSILRTIAGPPAGS